MNTALLHALKPFVPAGVTFDIRTLGDIPLYSEDSDQGHPPAGPAQLRREVDAADALVIATPEYNRAMSGVLKNALDWLTRPAHEGTIYGKATLALVATESGSYGLNAHVDLTTWLRHSLNHVVEPDFVLRRAHKKLAIDDDGMVFVTDSWAHDALKILMTSLVDLAARGEARADQQRFDAFSDALLAPRRAEKEYPIRLARLDDGREPPSARAVASSRQGLKFLGLSGSIRRDSLNTSFLRAIGTLLPPGVDYEVKPIDAVPLYNEDRDLDPPTSVQQLRQAVRDADALIVSSPEYDRHISGSLKNALDWLSRPAFSGAIYGKAALSLVATESSYHGINAHTTLTRLLRHLGVYVLEPDFVLRNADEKLRLTQDGEPYVADAWTEAFMRLQLQHLRIAVLGQLGEKAFRPTQDVAEQLILPAREMLTYPIQLNRQDRMLPLTRLSWG